MSSEQSPEWLPAGWTVRSKSNDYGKKIKFYVDPATGRKFYSKAQVFQHLQNAKTDTLPDVAKVIPEVGNIVPEVGNIVPEVVNVVPEVAKVAICSLDNGVNKVNESFDWLPDGWLVEERTRNTGVSVGSKFKVYTDPKSGHKFYSKPEVSRYLAKQRSTTPPLGITAANEVSSTVLGMKQTNEETKQTKQTNEETIGSPEWLPQGWSVESKIGEKGKKRKVYIDPASGFKFYSKPQVSRYLENITSNSSPQIGTGSKSSPQIITGSANNVSPILCLNQSTESGPSLKPDVSLTHQMNESKFEEKKVNGGNDSMDNGTFEGITDEKFPPGWVKEIRMRKTGDGQKDQFYIDPVSGYMFRSKVDALRYLDTGDVKMCKCRPMKRDISHLNLTNNNTPHDIDQSTEGKNLWKPEVSDKTNQSNISGDPSVVKASSSNVVVGKNSSEEIPPGWKIEYRSRNMAGRIVKDPYYLDPVSGYEFRSKPDVLRYLKTGDIKSCKIKPKKRDINDLNTDELISPLSAVEVKKLGTTTKRQFPGEIMDNTNVSKSAGSLEVGRSQNRRRSVPVVAMDFSSPAVHIHEASPRKISEPINKDSNGEETINLSSANDIILSVLNDIFNDDEVLGSEHSIEETQSSTKSKKKRVLNTPLRSSKRLAGINLNKPVKSSLGESSQAVAGNGEEIKANSSSHMNASAFKVPQQLQTQNAGEPADPTSIWKDNILSNESNGSGKKLVDQSVTENRSGKQVTEKLGDRIRQKESTPNAFVSEEITSNVYQMDKKGKGKQADALENHLERHEGEKQNDGRHESEQPPIEYPYMEDPCFEFAFKTLTGAIPVEENLSFQDYFKQQADTSQYEYNSKVEQQSETGQPSFSPVQVAPHSAVTDSPVPLQQWPPNSTFPASENGSIPSFTDASQQFGFGAGWQTKAK